MMKSSIGTPFTRVVGSGVGVWVGKGVAVAVAVGVGRGVELGSAVAVIVGMRVAVAVLTEVGSGAGCVKAATSSIAGTGAADPTRPQPATRINKKSNPNTLLRFKERRGIEALA